MRLPRERATGFEPVAFSLARRRSTTEPRPHIGLCAGRECREPESNWRHRNFQSRALPTELSRPAIPRRGCPCPGATVILSQLVKMSSDFWGVQGVLFGKENRTASFLCKLHQRAAPACHLTPYPAGRRGRAATCWGRHTPGLRPQAGRAPGASPAPPAAGAAGAGTWRSHPPPYWGWSPE
jgi:hypothetical protein